MTSKLYLLHIAPVLGRLLICNTVHRLHRRFHFCQLHIRIDQYWWMCRIFSVLCFYLLWKPCNIFINCQFCVDKDAWSLKQQKNIITSTKSFNIYLNLSCNRFIFGVFVNTWTVVRKVVPNRGSLSALLFPWIWVRITWTSSGFRAICEIWNHVTHYRPAFNSLFIQNSPQYKSTCRKNSFSIPWSTSYHPSLTQNVSTPGRSSASN